MYQKSQKEFLKIENIEIDQIIIFNLINKIFIIKRL